MRRQRRRRRIRSLLLAGAAFVAPNAAKAPVATASMEPAAVTRRVTEPRGIVTTLETFQLPAESAYDGLINEAAKRYGLPAALIRAVIMTESEFDPLAVSSAGAQGLMQLMPALSSQLGVSNAFDPRQNIMAGAHYLSALLGTQKGDMALALASYNAGPGNVERYQGIPPFEETQRYVKKIMDLVAEGDTPN